MRMTARKVPESERPLTDWLRLVLVRLVEQGGWARVREVTDTTSGSNQLQALCARGLAERREIPSIYSASARLNWEYQATAAGHALVAAS